MDTTPFKAPNTLPPPHPLETEVRQAEAALALATAEANAAEAGSAEAQTRLACARVSSAKASFEEEARRREDAKARANKEAVHAALVTQAERVNDGIRQAMIFIRESLEAHARLAQEAAGIEPSIFSHYKAIPAAPDTLRYEDGESGPHPTIPVYRRHSLLIEFADARDARRWRFTLPIDGY